MEASKPQTLASEDHPARLFGARLKKLRRERHIVSRLLARTIGKTPSRYCEVEHGILGDFCENEVRRIASALGLDQPGRQELLDALALARTQPNLGMADIFTREQLMPMIPPRRGWNGERMSMEEVEAMMDVVFTAA